MKVRSVDRVCIGREVHMLLLSAYVTLTPPRQRAKAIPASYREEKLRENV
jgi:hypothetical protein